MNQWKSAHAVDTKARSLYDALKGADVFFGVSVKGALTPDMLRVMAPNPIIFAMANPDPEITPEEAAEVRDDAIVATGRSDYPNQVNNVLGFPYIFRGALDVQAITINDDMKVACANALAELAREEVPDEVAAAYRGNRPKFGPEYIIPVPFDPRLIHAIPPAVAQAAMDSGVARRPIVDMEAYKHQLSARRDPVAGTLQRIFSKVRQQPKRVVFAEGEEEPTIRAATSFVSQGLGEAILIGREDEIKHVHALSAPAFDIDRPGITLQNARLSDRNNDYAQFLYSRLQRSADTCCATASAWSTTTGTTSGAIMVARGDADAMVTGLTRNYSVALDTVRACIDHQAGSQGHWRIACPCARADGSGGRHGGDRHAEFGRTGRYRGRGGACRA
jgi:malate dehydrogenase (oxaloacetate-decarboxylating)(NADP+)